jgi:hypothetical protein
LVQVLANIESSVRFTCTDCASNAIKLGRSQLLGHGTHHTIAFRLLDIKTANLNTLISHNSLVLAKDVLQHWNDCEIVDWLNAALHCKPKTILVTNDFQLITARGRKNQLKRVSGLDVGTRVLEKKYSSAPIDWRSKKFDSFATQELLVFGGIPGSTRRKNKKKQAVVITWQKGGRI